MTWQDEVFVERLVRLDQNHALRNRQMSHRGTWAGGADDRWTVDLGRVASVLGAAVIGLVSVPLLRLAMFHSQGLPDSSSKPELVMMIDAIFAFCIAFFLVRAILSVTSRAHMIAQVAGIWLALTSMHNLVHAYPDHWAQAFSPEWVERVIQMTEPNTLYLVGLAFP